MIERLFILVFLHPIFQAMCSIVFQHALASVIERKITLMRDACFKASITITFHDLYVGDIRGAMNEITSYH
jgi:hypothetical protein